MQLAGPAVALGRGQDPSPALADWHSRPEGHRWAPPEAPHCSRLCQGVLQAVTKSFPLALGKTLWASAEGHCPRLLLLPTFPAKNKQNRGGTNLERETSAHWEKNGYKRQEEELFLSC